MVPSSMSTLQNWCKNVTTTTKIGKKLCTCESIKHISLVFTQHCSATRRFFYIDAVLLSFSKQIILKNLKIARTPTKSIFAEKMTEKRNRGGEGEREKKRKSCIVHKLIFFASFQHFCVTTAQFSTCVKNLAIYSIIHTPLKLYTVLLTLLLVVFHFDFFFGDFILWHGKSFTHSPKHVYFRFSLRQINPVEWWT